MWHANGNVGASTYTVSVERRPVRKARHSALTAEASAFRHGEYVTATNIVGAFSLLLDTPRTSDVTASEAVQVLEIDREIFNAIIEAHPQFLLMLTRIWLRWLLAQESNWLVGLAQQHIKAPWCSWSRRPTSNYKHWSSKRLKRAASSGRRTFLQVRRLVCAGR